MSEFSSFKDKMDAGYRAIEGIQSDTSLTPDEQEELIRLDPTVEQVQRDIADIFADEEALAKRLRQDRRDGQDPK